ncbi:selT/selW/selH selenoprotein [Opisthorchis viverrini]|uniref:SelT/selW/selH selenoprotein n=1 Tax=Opisthorchis viverrini TaxID=6198 RepID=A0A1S8WU54_OPIVI|nr:selT/selW/selH selenoprotein [Opisthorchis viverrini]
MAEPLGQGHHFVGKALHPIRARVTSSACLSVVILPTVVSGFPFPSNLLTASNTQVFCNVFASAYPRRLLFKVFKKDLEARFPGKLRITGEGTPMSTGFFEVQLDDGTVLHSKKVCPYSDYYASQEWRWFRKF